MTEQKEPHYKYRAVARALAKVANLSTPVLVAGTTLGVIAIILNALGPTDLANALDKVRTKVDWPAAFAATFSMIAAGLTIKKASSLFFKYLDTGVVSAQTKIALDRMKQLEGRVTSIGAALESTVSAAMSPEERSELTEQVAQRIRNEASDVFLSELEQRAVRSFGERMRDRTIRMQFSRTIERLSAELIALQRRGTTNLFIGILITLAGIAMLVTFLFVTPNIGVNPWEFFAHYAPRLTLVILVEVFAYFFLRLYKSNLDDIKYFQNEITNIEAKHVALQAVFFADDKSLLSEVVLSLSKTERNHILEKGQTTVELERARIDQTQTRAVAKEAASIISAAFGLKKKDDEKPKE